MITFTNDSTKVIVNANLSNWGQGVPLPGFSQLTIQKNGVSEVMLNENETFIIVRMSSGNHYVLSYLIVDPSEGCTNNIELYNKLNSYLS